MLIYDKIYKQNKTLYNQLLSINMKGGGNSKNTKLINILAKDLYNVNKQVNKKIKVKRVKKKERRSKKYLNRQYLSRSHNDIIIYETSLFENIYELPEIELSGKYLDKYNKLIFGSETLLFAGFIHNKFYEYQFKLLQKLSHCGLNRTTQLYGTCWLNSILNTIIFGPKFRNRMIQIMDKYIEYIGIDNFHEKVKLIENKKYNLSNDIEKNTINIFWDLISIIYKLLCSEGLRNKDPTKYENFLLTNFAAEIQNYDNKEDKIQDFKTIPGYNSYLAFMSIIKIWNIRMIDDLNKNKNAENFIDGLLSYGTKTILYYFEYKNMFNDITLNAINILQCYTNHDTKISYISSFDNSVYFENIDVILKQNDVLTNLNFDYGEILRNLENIHFIILTGKMNNYIIPEQIICTVYEKTVKFNLESAILRIHNNDISHVITGLICDNEYYIYDSAYDLYIKLDWRNLERDNFKQYINFYDVVNSDFVIIYNEKLGKNVIELKNEKYVKKIAINLGYAIYYNSEFDFSYKAEYCVPHRPNKL